MNFLSHGPEGKKSLDVHLVDVANKSRELACQSSFKNPDIAYFAGLFHDLGKLNPYYQKLFTNKPINPKWDQFHSLYSGWIATQILKNIRLDTLDKYRILLIIYAHHSKLRREPGNCYSSKNGENDTPKRVEENWKKFQTQTTKNDILCRIPSDMKLNTKRLKFGSKIQTKQNEDSLEVFLQCGFYFSCVLQGDRSSFAEFIVKKLDNTFKLNMTKLHSNKGSNIKLLKMRRCFAKLMSETLDATNPITVINAPTGSGKTGIFLDAIKKYNPHRVFYFSPLLALTDDIASKVGLITDKNQVLVYHNIFSNTLDKIDNKNTENKWNFDHESFNEKFVITTTKRLLMSIYSNSAGDKIKLASFRNSLLIIDEVQTLPKFLLKNLMKTLEMLSQKINLKVLLASATIPYELCNIPRYGMQADDLTQYLNLKNRKIICKKTLEIQNITKNSLVMLNTRKASKDAFYKIQKIHKDVTYVSSGIKKTKREQILNEIKNKENSTILVCTQVLESGVDVSFSSVWRQMAPLDNIIQVLGRLDREAQDTNSIAFIFDVDSPKHAPYSSLEYQESQKIIKEISDSKQLYEKLDEYYKKISTENRIQKQNEDILDEYIKKLDFENVWKMIQENTGDSYYDSVYIPELKDWDGVKSDLLSKNKSKRKKHVKLLASLPVKKWTLKDSFDEVLFDDDILLPKKEKLDEIYDKQMGLDICIQD